MLEYKDFYEIAEYGNENWKGSFTPREIAENAYDYLCEFETSKETKYMTHTMVELVKLLNEDGSEEGSYWAEQIVTEIYKTEEKITISGIIFQHGTDDFSLWEGFNLTKEDSDAIQTILSKYETEGYSVRGTKTDVAKEIAEFVDDLEYKNWRMELQYKDENEEEEQ